MCAVCVRAAQARGNRDRKRVENIKAARAVGVTDVDAANVAATKVQVRRCWVQGGGGGLSMCVSMLWGASL